MPDQGNGNQPLRGQLVRSGPAIWRQAKRVVRICEELTCDTVLSSFNSSKTCSVHGGWLQKETRAANPAVKWEGSTAAMRRPYS